LISATLLWLNSLRSVRVLPVSRNAVITSFNTDVSLVGVWQSNQDKISYLIGQKEICPSSGREHWQVYVEFKDRVRLSVIQGASMFDAKCHIEVRKGTSKEASDYCKKDASRAPGQEPPGYYEFGLISSQGKAEPILRVYVTLLRPVAPITQVLDDHVNVAAKYPTYVKMRMSLVPAPFRERPRIIILIGPSGCGKSRWVRDNTPSSETFWANDTKETWFDGYAHQPIIYFDEFRGRFPLQDMLKLLDWHRLQLPVKGGYTNIHASTFIFSSNAPWREWYNLLNHEGIAFERRVTEFSVFISEEKESENLDPLGAQWPSVGVLPRPLLSHLLCPTPKEATVEPLPAARESE